MFKMNPKVAEKTAAMLKENAGCRNGAKIGGQNGAQNGAKNGAKNGAQNGPADPPGPHGDNDNAIQALKIVNDWVFSWPSSLAVIALLLVIAHLAELMMYVMNFHTGDVGFHKSDGFLLMEVIVLNCWAMRCLCHAQQAYHIKHKQAGIFDPVEWYVLTILQSLCCFVGIVGLVCMEIPLWNLMRGFIHDMQEGVRSFVAWIWYIGWISVFISFLSGIVGSTVWFSLNLQTIKSTFTIFRWGFRIRQWIRNPSFLLLWAAMPSFASIWEWVSSCAPDAWKPAAAPP